MRAPLLLFAAIPVVVASAQTDAQDTLIAGAFDAFTTDEMGNVYTVQGDVLALYNTHGQLLQRNSLKTFGRIGTIDAFYSLKPMVFAQEQAQLAVLDNTLAVQGSVIDLPRNGYAQVTLACTSVQNSFWFFDQKELELVRVDAQLRPLARTGRLDQLIGFAPEPTRMIERDNWLYVNDPANGLLVFDLFGTYAKLIPITGITGFEVRSGRILYRSASAFTVFDTGTFISYPVPSLDGPAVRDARVENGIAYVLTDAGITLRRVGGE